MNQKNYPAIPPTTHTGNEPFLDASGSPFSSLASFWSWAYSDLMDNTQRGMIAEYLVACALGIQNVPRISWNRYDLETPDGITVEVKASGYLQTWEQVKPSKIIFRIPKTHGWNSVTNEYDPEERRQADVYIFCVHNHTEKETANPLDTRQWEFYVVATEKLNEACGDQKTVSLAGLKKIGTVVCGYDRLAKMIRCVANPVMKVKYIGESDPLRFLNGKIYEVLSIEHGWYRIIDETGEDYLYPPEHFEELT